MFLNKKFLNEKTYVLLSLLVGCFIIYGSFLLGYKLLIYNDTGSDTFDSYWPMISELRDRLGSGELPFYSFRTAGGINLFSTSIFMGDPFTIIYLFFSEKTLPYSFAFVTTLKIVLAGFFFYRYAKYINISSYLLPLSAILYAFNGYVVLWGQFYPFINVILFIPLLLWGYEKWMREKKIVHFVGSTFLLAVNSFYFFYMASIFFLIYAIVSYVSKNKVHLLKFIKFASQTIGLYLIGIGCAAFLLGPVISYMMNSPRISGSLGIKPFDWNTPLHYYSTLFRLFSNNTLGIAAGFHGYINYYESPILFSSVLFILLLFHIRYVFSTKEKWLTVLCFFIALAFLCFPFFSSIFNAFNKVDFRWSFILVISEIILTLVILDRILKQGKIRRGVLLSSFVIVLGSFWCLFFYSKEKFSWLISYNDVPFKIGVKVTLYILVYTLILFFINARKQSKYLISFLILVVFSEVTVDAYITVNKRDNVHPDYINSKAGYFDATSSIVQDINFTDKEFFRINKDFNSRFLDDALLQKYNGIKSYNSLNDPSYLQFLGSYNVPVYANNILITGLGNKAQLESLMGVKYLLSRNPNTPFGFSPVGEKNGIYYFINENSLSLGFMFDRVITEDQFNSFTPDEKDESILKAAVLSDAVVKKLNLPIANLVDKVKSELANVEFEVSKNPNINDSQFPQRILIDALNNVDLELPLAQSITGKLIITFRMNSPIETKSKIFWKSNQADYNPYQDFKEIDIHKGDNEYEIHLDFINNLDAIKLLLPQVSGEYTVEKIKIQRITLGSFLQDVEARKEHELQNVTVKSNVVTGEINAPYSGLLFLSIPFNEGWKATVDGKNERVVEVDNGLSGLMLDKGNHQVRLKYTPPFLIKGLIISLISFLAFVFILLLNRRIQRRNPQEV